MAKQPQLVVHTKLPTPTLRRPTDEETTEERRLAPVMEQSETPQPELDRSGSSDSDELPVVSGYGYQAEPSYQEDSDHNLTYTPTATPDYTPSTGFSSGFSSWNSYSNSRPQGGSGGATTNGPEKPAPEPRFTPIGRGQRPSAPLRTPSNTYAPARRPPQFSDTASSRTRSTSNMRTSRRDPNAQYRAQEKAYVQRVRQDPSDWAKVGTQTPSLGHSTDSETEEESPSSDLQFDNNDPYDPETNLFLVNDNIQPSAEELAVPENRERLEWHAMLGSVLKGDVVRQEKQRLIGNTEQKTNLELNGELWLGVKARSHGRTIAIQKRMIEDRRATIGPIIESVTCFQIKGETEVGKPPAEQVEDVVRKIEKCESLYSTRKELETAQPRAASSAFQESCDAIMSWHNTTQVINTELSILQGWVGNEELDFHKPRKRSDSGGKLVDESSFIDRILKEDGLKSLQGKHSMLNPIGEVIKKAKNTLIHNAETFAERHLLLTLKSF